jgi:hypothetical protein
MAPGRRPCADARSCHGYGADPSDHARAITRARMISLHGEAMLAAQSCAARVKDYRAG